MWSHAVDASHSPDYRKRVEPQAVLKALQALPDISPTTSRSDVAGLVVLPTMLVLADE
jgi:hypothetical protein